MNNILLDFSSIKSGGGAQLASAFLSNFSNLGIFDKFDVYLLLPNVGPLSSLGDIFEDLHILYAPNSNFKRFFFENVYLQFFLKKHGINLIFTFFGPGLPHDQSVKSIVSTAYPIICYPDSLYWKNVPFFEKLRKKIWNFMRCKRLKNADLIIAETEIMKKRLMRTLGLDGDCVHVLPPSASSHLKDYSRNLNIPPSKFLVLSNNAFHKNLRLLIDVAEELERHDDQHVKFYMSISKNEFLNSIKREFDTKIVDKRFSFFGCVSPNEVYEKYIESDALINISDLESFSNNYMEAWKTNTPLIVSDRDFARNICGDSALYVDPYNPKDVVMAILKLRKNYDLRKKMTDCGKEKLQELPSLYTRNSIIMEKIKKIM